jgi:predicted RNA-binding protein YlxR (DUF448 family)
MTMVHRSHQPLRSCIACRRKGPKHELLRIVRTPEGRLEIDEEAKKPGRGAYLCRIAACGKKALKGRGFQRKLNVSLPDGFEDQLLKIIR